MDKCCHQLLTYEHCAQVFMSVTLYAITYRIVIAVYRTRL